MTISDDAKWAPNTLDPNKTTHPDAVEQTYALMENETIHGMEDSPNETSVDGEPKPSQQGVGLGTMEGSNQQQNKEGRRSRRDNAKGEQTEGSDSGKQLEKEKQGS